jgi:hypothetical protein
MPEGNARVPVALAQEADAASSSVTLGAGTTAGNTVIVAVACLSSSASAGVTGVTLGGSPDNFTLIAPGPSAHDTTSPNDYLNVSVWADANCLAGGTAIVVTGTGVLATWAYEFSGLQGSADVARVLAVSTYQDSWLASTAPTTVPAEAWIAVAGAANQTATPTPSITAGNGWTAETAYNGTSGSYDWAGVSAYQTVNTVGTPVFNGNHAQPSLSVVAIVTLGAGAPPVASAAIAPLTGNVTVRQGGLSVHGNVAAGGVVTQGGTPVNLIPVGPKTGNYTAKPGDFVLTNYGAGLPALPVITLPAAPPNGALIGVKLLTNPAGLLTVQASGADVIDAVPAATTQINPTGTGTVFVLQYQTSTATWYTQSTGTQLPPPPAMNSPQPSDLGYVTWAYDPAVMNGTLTGVALPSSGNVTLVRCPVRATMNISTIEVYATASGSSLTSGENFAGVYTSAGALLCATADQTSNWTASGAPVTASPVGAPFAVNPPWVWAAFLCNGSTGPSFAATANVSAAWANGHPSSGRGYRYAQLVGTFTSLPSSFALIGGAGGYGTAATQYWTALY